MDALMTFLQRVARNSQPLTGLVSAVIGVLVVAGILEPDPRLIGAVMALVGALVVFLSAYITPVSDPRLAVGTVVNATTTKAPTGIVVEAVTNEAGEVVPK